MWDPSASLDDEKKTKTLKKKISCFSSYKQQTPKNQIKSTKPFITIPKKMNHLSMYLTNHVKEMYVEN